MSKRIFIIGGGRFGVHLAARLCESGCEVVIGDDNAERVEDLADEGYHAIEMDANDEQALRDSGALQADVVVVAIGENMQASILTTLLLKQLQAKRVIARTIDRKHAQVLERLGADEVVMPVRDMAYQLAERLRDNAEGQRRMLVGTYQVAEITLGGELAGRIFDAPWLRKTYGVTPILVQQAEDNKVSTREPGPDVRLTPGDILWVAGTRERINHFEKDCGAHS